MGTPELKVPQGTRPCCPCGGHFTPKVPLCPMVGWRPMGCPWWKEMQEMLEGLSLGVWLFQKLAHGLGQSRVERPGRRKGPRWPGTSTFSSQGERHQARE